MKPVIVKKNVTYKSQYDTYQVNILLGYYESNMARAIMLEDAEDGSPIATATVNIDGVASDPDEVLIKNYSENKGILPFLQKEGIIGEVIDNVDIGYVSVQLCKLLVR